MKAENDVVITGIGIVTSQGVGIAPHAAMLNAERVPAPVVETERFAPYPIHPLPAIDWSAQIPKRGDQRQMENWQRLGVFSAGLALDDAGLKDDLDACGTMDMIVAAGGGERDIAVDSLIVDEALKRNDREQLLNEKLTTELRPTLFLAQLSNLLAGNISIVHKVTGSSRTFMGEEAAGISAFETAFARIKAGQSTHTLVGGALSAERLDIVLLIEAIGGHAVGAWQPLWSRSPDDGGGIVLGSAGAFLMLESRAHAEARGARIYATIAAIGGDRGKRDDGRLETRLDRLAETVGETGETVVFSGASGLTEHAAREKDWLEGRFPNVPVRAYGSIVGHGIEAQFPLGLALAALALKEGACVPAFDPTEAPMTAPARQAVVTAIGHARGEGVAVLVAEEQEGRPMTGAYKDHLGRPLIAVTGMGVITSLGQGVVDNWAALTGGVSGIHNITRFPTDGLSTRISGTVDFISVPAENSVERSYAMARETTLEALAQAGLSGDFEGPLFLAAPPIEPEWSARFALADRSGPSQKTGDAYDRFLAAMRVRPDPSFHEAVLFGAISERLADRFGTRGLPVTLSTACASGATAIQLGVEAIRQGRTDRALTVATDGSVSAEALIRFSLLSALSTQNDPPERASKPFTKDRDGFVIAEGAATLVLESLEAAVARGAKVLGILKGCGEKADLFHRTRSSPDGGPAIATIRAALADAGIGEGGIGYINAHGTSTPENDKMEYQAMSAVFGEGLARIPVSSNKSMIGHTLTAAGAVEAVFSLQTILTGTVPPTINYQNPDPAIGLDVVPNVKRDVAVTAVLSNSFGFGGQNASLVMTAEPA